MHYQFYHVEDLEKILKELRGVKPRFKKFERTEIYTEGIVVGKYNDVVFVISEEPLSLSKGPMGVLKVEFDEKVSLENDTLKIDRRDEKTLFDYIPSLFSEYFKIKALFSEINSYAEKLSKYEDEVSQEIKSMTTMALSEDIESFENALKGISRRHCELLSWMCTLKRLEIEVSKSLTNFKMIARDDVFNEIYGNFEFQLRYYKTIRESFEKTLNRLTELFQMISLKLDAIRNKEYMEMQKKTSALQVAAGVIEFLAVFYYTLKSWEYFINLEEVPKVLTFTLLTLFTVSVVWLTDGLSEVMVQRRITKKVVLLSVLISVTFALMVNVTSFSKFLELLASLLSS